MDENNKEVILTSGNFDLFHVGHLNILKRSKALGGFLIVALTPDELIEKYKGILPVIPFEERMDILKACKYVDLVIPQTELSDIKNMKKYNVTIYTLGDDWKGKGLEGVKWAKQNNINVVYFPYTPHRSSSGIKRHIINNTHKIISADLKKQYNLLPRVNSIKK